MDERYETLQEYVLETKQILEKEIIELQKEVDSFEKQLLLLENNFLKCRIKSLEKE